MLRLGGRKARQPVLVKAAAKADARRSDPALAEAAEERLMQDKGWQAMGAFDPVERSRVLDVLGFKGQLVFATFATSMFAGRDADRLYAGLAAQNKAMVNFCASDDRLHPVAYVSLVDPVKALAAVTEAVEIGSAAVMVPSTAAG